MNNPYLSPLTKILLWIPIFVSLAIMAFAAAYFFPLVAFLVGAKVLLGRLESIKDPRAIVVAWIWFYGAGAICIIGQFFWFHWLLD